MVELEENEILNIIKNSEENLSWIFNNINDLRRKYPDQFIFVKDKIIIEHGKDYKEIIEKLREMGVNLDYIVMQFIPKDKISMVV